MMPVYDISASDRFPDSIDVPRMGLADPGWAITIHQRPLHKTHKQLPRRRDHSLPTIDLRSHYKKTQAQLPDGHVRQSQNLSTTPPNVPETRLFEPSSSPIPIKEPSEHGRDDSSTAETTILRSRVATPTHHNSPPTPDRTPPRPDDLLRPRLVLVNVPSVSSRAESFKTAREELSSDEDDIDDESPLQRPSRQRWLRNNQATQMEGWKARPSPLVQAGESSVTPTKNIKHKPLPTEPFATFDGTWDTKEDGRDENRTSMKPPSSLDGSITTIGDGESVLPITSQPSNLPTPPHSADVEERQSSPQLPLHRGKSLRDRLEEMKMVRASHSTEQFAQDIGWSHVYRLPDLQNRTNSWRLSGISTTSTVEAIVVEAETPPQRNQQLRHCRKNSSLRSASSPFPASKRDSLLSNSESPHRLVHKKGNITNKTRWSMGSEASRAEISRPSRVSLAMSDPVTPETIHVAVIPERKSSLQSSENTSRRHSAALSMSSAGNSQMVAPVQPPAESHVLLRKKRVMSASLPAEASMKGRGKDRRIPPAVPTRGSSLSAPTSRSNSRANSLTSEHFRLRRLAAEEDLHRTLERMESERSVVPRNNVSSARKSSRTHPAETGSDHGDALSPPSQYTPFSQHSMEFGSPGPVEMGEARAVNLFAHNNHSLQIVDQFPQPESRAVLSPQKVDRKGGLPVEEPSTPKQTALPQLSIDSPLRNPRDPPEPPTVKVIPPTPADLTPVEDNNRQLGFPSPGTSTRKTGALSRRFGSLKRPSLGSRHQSESFVRSLGRTLSLRGPRNMKADQNLDANLHPFWRPRGFWDDITNSDSELDEYEDDVIVSNSLGVPQERTITDGPISLMRRLSDNSRRHRRDGGGITKRSSHGSLSDLRAGRRMNKKTGWGRQFPFMSLRELQDRLPLSSWRKEDERREKSRQALRSKIGSQIISTGDSRYPAYMPSAPASTAGRRQITDG